MLLTLLIVIGLLVLFAVTVPPLVRAAIGLRARILGRIGRGAD